MTGACRNGIGGELLTIGIKNEYLVRRSNTELVETSMLRENSSIQCRCHAIDRTRHRNGTNQCTCVWIVFSYMGISAPCYKKAIFL